MKYKVGDKVRVRKDLSIGKSYCMNGKKERNVAVEDMVKLAGKIVEIESVTNQYRIKGSIFLWTDEMFDPVNTRKIVITSDGVETLARLYDGNKVIKTATAKCSPDDTFVFEEGARIALHRMLGDYAEVKVEKPHEYKAGDKVKVIGSRCCHGMKTGEVVTLDRVWEDGAYSKAWLTKEYANKWYIRECDFEPYTEPKKKPLKIKKGKKYILKPYDEVEEHLGLSKETWGEIAKRYVVAESVSTTVGADTCYHGRWVFVPEAFEKEYIEEKPKYYNGKVVCIKAKYSDFWTVGKIYDIKDGTITRDTGSTIAGLTKEDILHVGHNENEFVPVVE